MPRIKINGAFLNYETEGDGPAFVFAHANPFDHSLWLYQIHRYSLWFRVIALDLRGYGRSERTPHCSVPLMTGDVAALLDELGIDQCVYCGNSVGGRVGLQLALDSPERLRALIVVGSTPSGRENAAAFAQRVQGYKTVGIRGGYYESHLRSLLSPEFQQSRIGDYLVNLFLERGDTLQEGPIVASFESSQDWSVKEELHKIRLPLLVIAGEKDRARQRCREIHELVPGARYYEIAGAGHACGLEAPDEFDRAVFDFLRSNDLMPKPNR